VTPSAGGHGAGRDTIDLILDAKGVLLESMEEYLRQAGTATDIGHDVQ
jgi:3-deoxy-D-manno-octulosonate 8-phosphate phosphatase (KDO 8-P phosphatase)